MHNRSFLVILCLLSFACGPAGHPPKAEATTSDSATQGPELRLVAPKEPGEKIEISGTVFLPDGRNPAKYAVLAFWQTDSTGNYVAGGGGAGEIHPRIHGRLKTGADGKYTLYSIRPGQYPSHTTPAHIHAHISAPGFPEYALIYYFEGDDLVTDRNRAQLNSSRGGTPSIITLTRGSDGVLRGHRDLILEYVKPSGETLTLQW